MPFDVPDAAMEISSGLEARLAPIGVNVRSRCTLGSNLLRVIRIVGGRLAFTRVDREYARTRFPFGPADRRYGSYPEIAKGTQVSTIAAQIGIVGSQQTASVIRIRWTPISVRRALFAACGDISRRSVAQRGALGLVRNEPDCKTYQNDYVHDNFDQNAVAHD